MTGHRFSTGWTPGQTVYFVARFSEPFESALLISGDGEIAKDAQEITSANPDEPVRALLSWQDLRENTLLVKVGISSVSAEGALKNLDTENPGWDFEAIREQAGETWNKVLNHVLIKSDNTALKRTFYTALYHSYIAPNLYSDADGYFNNTRNEKQKADGHNMYYTFSLWDTFRAWHPLMTIVEPEKVREFIKALFVHYEDYGLLPKWNLWGNETYCMIGYHSVPVIVDAWFKGLVDEADADALYDAMISAATGRDQTKRYEGLDLYIEYGYMPEDIVRTWWEDGSSHSQSASQTMEWAYDDWCIAQMAKDLGREADYETYMNRSGSIKNLFDPETRLIRPRNSDGSWVTPFDPGSARHGNGFTEGNSWQYSWFYPHNVYEFIELMGGPEVFAARLDTLFEHLSADDIQFHDVTGLIGQYAHGNEPSHHIAYLYNYVGQPWKTQERVTEIMNTMYTDQRDGLCGNEDCGQMSAWYVFSAMGLYPVNPCGCVYVFGRPFFEDITIQLESGASINIRSENFSDENAYVQQVIVNGKEHQNFWISHEELISGCEIRFIMGDQPNQKLWTDSAGSPI